METWELKTCSMVQSMDRTSAVEFQDFVADILSSDRHRISTFDFMESLSSSTRSWDIRELMYYR